MASGTIIAGWFILAFMIVLSSTVYLLRKLILLGHYRDGGHQENVTDQLLSHFGRAIRHRYRQQLWMKGTGSRNSSRTTAVTCGPSLTECLDLSAKRTTLSRRPGCVLAVPMPVAFRT